VTQRMEEIARRAQRLCAQRTVLPEKLLLVEVSLTPSGIVNLRSSNCPCASRRKSDGYVFNVHELSNAVSLAHDVGGGLISEEPGRGWQLA